MLTLCIETSFSIGFLLLIDQKKVLELKVLDTTLNLSKNLLPSIQELLSSHHFTLKDLQAIAVGIGPGSFTGTRVGVMVGKSLSFGLNIPLFDFYSPFAFFPDCSGNFGYLADAKMNEFFLQKGVKNKETFSFTSDPLLFSKNDLSQKIEGMDFLVTSCEEANALNIKRYQLTPNPTLIVKMIAYQNVKEKVHIHYYR